MFVVFHAAKARRVMDVSTQKFGWMHAPVGDTTDSHFEIARGSVEANVLYLHHAARGWMGKQWEPVVEPVLALLRRAGKIPI